MGIDFKFYLSLFMRRLHYFLIITGLVTAAGFVVAYTLPPVYRAEALLLVESAQISGELAASTVSAPAAEQLQIINQRLKTRANLLDVADRFDIYDAVARRNPDNVVDSMRDRTIITLPNRRDAASFVSVSFEADTADLSAEVTNEFVTLILRENVELRTRVASQTLDFFEQEVGRLTAELAEQGARITAFKLANEGSLPESTDYRRTRQAAQQERLLQMARDLDRLQDRRVRLVDLYERTGRVEAVTSNMTQEQRRLLQLETELSAALTIYSPQNPRIRALEGQVAAMRQVVGAQQGAGGEDGLSAFELQLADIDGQIEYLNEQRGLIEEELESLETSLQATPANEIALDVLERDYANIQMQYAQASDRMAQAVTGERIEALSRGQRISVIEQATVPRKPASPNRPLVAFGALFAGIVLGLGFVILLELMNRSIRRPVELSERLGIAPFATIPYIRTQGEMVARRSIISTGFLIVLVGIPAALYALHLYYLPMDLMIERVADHTGLSGLINQIQNGF